MPSRPREFPLSPSQNRTWQSPVPCIKSLVWLLAMFLINIEALVFPPICFLYLRIAHPIKHYFDFFLSMLITTTLNCSNLKAVWDLCLNNDFEGPTKQLWDMFTVQLWGYVHSTKTFLFLLQHNFHNIDYEVNWWIWLEWKKISLPISCVIR